jgi:pyruvate carboxylase
MNPRIQVEHTVTEEVTDVDLVQSQIRIAAGETLDDLGLTQDAIQIRGAAMQCRVTTEDPSNGFRPDTGKLTTYRSPGGAGVRLDGGTVFAGSEIGAHFDSMLVKLTTRGRTFDIARRRMSRALSEFRIRGVSTNIPFLEGVIDDPAFRAGTVTTSFIDERPHLLNHRVPADRGTKLLKYLAGVTVNKPYGEPRTLLVAPTKLPPLDTTAPPPAVAAQLLELAAEGSRGLRARTASPSPTRPSRCPPVAAATGTHPRPHQWRLRLVCCRNSGRARPGAAPPMTWRSGSSRRTPGSGWPSCTS